MNLEFCTNMNLHNFFCSLRETSGLKTIFKLEFQFYVFDDVRNNLVIVFFDKKWTNCIMWNHLNYLNFRGQFSWFVNSLRVRGDIISCIGWLVMEGGGVCERKNNSGKVYFILNELSFFITIMTCRF